MANANAKHVIIRTSWLYHYSNEGETSWAIFAEEIMALSGLNCTVNHVPTSEYPTAARRPEFSLMSKQKLAETFDVVIPECESSLEEIITKLQAN